MEMSVVEKKKRVEQNWQKAVPMHPSSNNHAVMSSEMTNVVASNRKANKLKVFVRIRPDESSEVQGNRIGTIETLLGGIIPTYALFDSNAMKYARHGSSSSKVRPLSREKSGRNSGSLSINENGDCVPIKEYKFERVLGSDSSQELVYKETTAPIVEYIFCPNEHGQSQSGLLFAYGITNAGKSYTIDNCKKNPSEWGVLLRAMHRICSRLQSDNSSYQLKMSYFKICNEKIFDLLPIKEETLLSIAPSLNHFDKGQNGGIVVKGITKYDVSRFVYLSLSLWLSLDSALIYYTYHISIENGLTLIKEASKDRQICSNNINSSSSHSHCICHFELVNKSAGEEFADPANLWIVDLAGSERSKRTQFGNVFSKQQQREPSQINQSLTTLMRCITQLANSKKADQQQMLPPYRDSKLTFLFMNHLNGRNACKTAMIVNINPSASDYDETQHVLSYATAAREVLISSKDYYSRAIKINTDNAQKMHNKLKERSYNSYNERSLSYMRSASSMSSMNRKACKVGKPNGNKLSPRQALVRKASTLVHRNKKDSRNAHNTSKNAHASSTQQSLQALTEEIDFLRKENKGLVEENSKLQSDNTYLKLHAEHLEGTLFKKEADNIIMAFSLATRLIKCDVQTVEGVEYKWGISWMVAMAAYMEFLVVLVEWLNFIWRIKITKKSALTLVVVLRISIPKVLKLLMAAYTVRLATTQTVFIS